MLRSVSSPTSTSQQMVAAAAIGPNIGTGMDANSTNMAAMMTPSSSTPPPPPPANTPVTPAGGGAGGAVPGQGGVATSGGGGGGGNNSTLATSIASSANSSRNPPTGNLTSVGGGGGGGGGGTGAHTSGLNREQVYAWIQELSSPDTREHALIELSRKREVLPDLAPMLWHSFGTIAALLQEIVIIYPVINPPTLNVRYRQSAPLYYMMSKCIHTLSKSTSFTAFYILRLIVSFYSFVIEAGLGLGLEGQG